MKEIKIYRILNYLTLLILFLSIILPILFWKQIPDQIPSHYNSDGVADAWSGKETLFFIFFVELLLLGVMFISGYFVKASGTSAYATEKEKGNLAILPILGGMNLAVMGMFAYITFCSVMCRELGELFIPIVLIAVFAPVVLYIFRSGNGKKSKKEQIQLKKEEENGAGDTYRTRVDLWLAVLLLGSIMLVPVLSVRDYLKAGEMDWSGIVIMVPVFLLILPLFFIKYTLYEDHLYIGIGKHCMERIRYCDIIQIKPTWNPLASAAMSLRRVQIEFRRSGRSDMILISPVKREEFIGKLQKKMEKNCN